MPWKVALDKGWPVLLGVNERLPWSAILVSEHEDGQEAALAYDQLKRAVFAQTDAATPDVEH